MTCSNCTYSSLTCVGMLQQVGAEMGELEAADDDSDGASSRRMHGTTPDQIKMNRDVCTPYSKSAAVQYSAANEVNEPTRNPHSLIFLDVDDF